MALSIHTRSLTVNEAKARLLESEHRGLDPILAMIQGHPGTGLIVAALAGMVMTRSARARSLALTGVLAVARQLLK